MLVLERYLLSFDSCFHNLSALYIDIDVDSDIDIDLDIKFAEEERGLLLQKLWYSDVQRWAGELLLSVYRATHTAVWAQEIEGTITLNFIMANVLSSLSRCYYTNALF